MKSHLITFFLLAASLTAQNAVQPSVSTAGLDNVVETENETFYASQSADPINFSGTEGFNTVDLYVGNSLYHDSNVNLTTVEESALVSVTKFGVSYDTARRTQRLLHAGFRYGGRFYSYNSENAVIDRDGLEHDIKVLAGVNGAKTTIITSARYNVTNGNSSTLTRTDREFRNTASDDLHFDFSIVRDLPHGSLEQKAGYLETDFRDQSAAFFDRDSYYSDTAWFYRPGFTPRTSFGLGFRAQWTNVEGGFDQHAWTPSFRIRHATSGKTSMHVSIGATTRDVIGSPNDSENFSFLYGLTWLISSKSALNFDAYRRSRVSVSNIGQTYVATGAGLTFNHRFPRQFYLNTDVRYEHADYETFVVGGSTTREDDYVNGGITFGKEFRVTNWLEADASVFFHASTNDSTFFEFDQQLLGGNITLTF